MGIAVLLLAAGLMLLFSRRKAPPVNADAQMQETENAPIAADDRQESTEPPIPTESPEEAERRAYDEAVALYQSGDYTAAAPLFEALGEYEQAAQFARRCAWQNCQEGDRIFFGSYPQDDGEPEEIEWIVLERGDNGLLLLSLRGLDVQPYAPGLYPTWAASPIRDWLNGDFLNTAFTADEQALIASVTNSTDNYVSELGAYLGGPDSTEQIFLLSYGELLRYFPEKADRLCLPTDYALHAGAATKANGGCEWWLRTPGDHHGQCSRVMPSGAVSPKTPAKKPDVCVRPALWLTL